MSLDSLPYEERLVAFDSNVLTYFLDANNGIYSRVPDDPLAPERIAAVRLFLNCKPVIVPTVRAEAAQILDAAKAEEHLRFIGSQFIEFIPDEHQESAIERRTAELLPHHSRSQNDCRIVAEVEQDGCVPVLVTFDGRLVRDLSPHTRILLQSPVECWESFHIPRGTPPVWTPAPGHPLANETWWRW